MREKRYFKRLYVNLPVTLRCGGRLIPATTLNISCGGICLDVDGAEIATSDNKPVEIVIDLSQEERDVSLKGVVTRIEGADKSRVGIRFTNLYTVGYQTLEQFINRSLN